MGLTIVALGPDSGGVLAKTLRSGGLVGLLCDRDIVGNGVEVEFFGERTTFPAGPATLALRSGAPLVADGRLQRARAATTPPSSRRRSTRRGARGCGPTWRGSPRPSPSSSSG